MARRKCMFLNLMYGCIWWGASMNKGESKVNCIQDEILLRNENLWELMENVEVLDKVKQLPLIEGLEMATTEMVAEYYEVSKAVIEMCVSKNRKEFEKYGYIVCKAKDIDSISEFISENNSITKNRANFKIIDKEGNTILSGGGRGLALFSRKLILRIALLLRDSEIADKIKQELGLPVNSNIGLRKEILFKKELDNVVNKIIEENRKNIAYLPTSALYGKIDKGVERLLTYETQHSVLNGKYRIDFYFDKLNLAIEYDENYHSTETQKELDRQREYEIKREMYLSKGDKYGLNRSSVTEDELKEWDFNTYEEMFDFYYLDEEYKDIQDYHLLEFFRIREWNELNDLLLLTIKLTMAINEEQNNRAMSCRWNDLLQDEQIS